MATIHQNLSEYDAASMPEKGTVGKQKYAIVVADWNPEITHNLLRGAIDTLLNNGVKEDHIEIVHVPGTFELTYAASQLMKQKKYNAIIVIGCVIQGDTPHFTYVCEGVTQGIVKLNLIEDGVPVIFGVLTTNTLQQAKDRAGGIHGNKGDEAAVTAIKMANIFW